MPSAGQPLSPKPEGAASPARSLAAQLALATFCRLILNTSRRFAYPFAPVLSRGLDVPLSAVTTMIAANQATGMLALLFGPLGDRFGYRIMMMVGLGLMAAGMLTGAILPAYVVVLTALALAGLGKNLFDPSIQAYVGEKVPYERRALVVGLIEISWAGSTLIGVPLVGLLIEYGSWRSPFWVIGGLGLVGMVLLKVLMPNEAIRPAIPSRPRGFFRAWLGLARNRTASCMMAFAFLVSAGNDNLFVTYGIWFESTFQMRIAALGFGTALIGLAELGGESLTVLLGDRLGKKRALAGGLLTAAAAYAALPFLETSLPWTLAGVFLVFLATEFSIVTSLSLATEIIPESRATMMSGYLAAAGIGRVAGALAGGLMWGHGGITAVAGLSAILTLSALCVMLRGLAGGRRW
ncbi:MAG: MFS transporter [Desulfobacterales bacterium]